MVTLKANNNTLKTEIRCNEQFFFPKEKRFTSLLFFNHNDVLKANECHESPPFAAFKTH